MRTEVNKLLTDLCNANMFIKMEAYDLMSEHPNEDVVSLLKGAISREKNNLMRAYLIFLWAETSHILGCDEEAWSFVNELEQRSEIQMSGYCMGSCYYAEYLFGKQNVEIKVRNLLNSSDERVRIGAEYLLSDIKSDYAR